MYQEEHFHEASARKIDDIHRQDRGYNVIVRPVLQADGKIKQKRIPVYSSSGMGSRIRDAESGQHYSNMVGSLDEDLFFTVVLATGECHSANGSSTLFYLSPQHYMNHLGYHVSQEVINAWEAKRDARLHELKRK